MLPPTDVLACRRCGRSFSQDLHHRARGLDSGCYNEARELGQLDQYPPLNYVPDNELSPSAIRVRRYRARRKGEQS